ncbi:hypothetical protein B0H16DRAFT_1738380 [Mycena metata]|uniref:Uncharacterized protein n=1 Tax=Mycena metata TaxID=1033252 RepID=A0AAD7HIB8_9AGAR|nr:hypothetical protein B0H16DRAFT_1738380 [Mycena metata]
MPSSLPVESRVFLVGADEPAPFYTIQRIPGPPRSSWLLGNMLQLFLPPYGHYNDIWRKTYGTVYRFQGCFGVCLSMCSAL